MSARPLRRLSEEDRAFWLAWTARTQVVPLKGRAPLLTASAIPSAAPAAAAPAPVVAATPRQPVGQPVVPLPPPELRIGHSPGGVDARRWKELCRGKLRPQRRLDLHGQRVQEAHGAVRRFLHDACADGLRCVEIVTGKGPAPEGGVLRRELPHWLNAPELRHLLLGAAHPHTANPGSVYLLLRRRR
jgi:DNA-nicking Smr family endonuclease